MAYACCDSAGIKGMPAVRSTKKIVFSPHRHDRIDPRDASESLHADENRGNAARHRTANTFCDPRSRYAERIATQTMARLRSAGVGVIATVAVATAAAIY